MLENLVVRPDSPTNTTSYAVIAGCRRFAALTALAHDGAIEDNYEVPCLLLDTAHNDAELSLTENVVRAAMHPRRPG